jgi:hypothetical protein
MPSPIVPFLKEILPDKNIVYDYMSRHKVTCLLLISHCVLFFFILFLSEQNVQKETQLIEARRTALSVDGTPDKLVNCQVQLSAAKRNEEDARADGETIASDYRQLNQSLGICQSELAGMNALKPIPTTPPTEHHKRPSIHPPRRLRPTTSEDYQQMLEGV